MSSVAPVGRRLAATTAALFILILCQQAVGQAPAPRPADKLAVDMAVDKGVKFLRESQNPNGAWGNGTGAGGGKGWGVGYTALAGIALLECGVPTSDPGLKKALAAVRFYADSGDLVDTYEVSLAILFLDRMNGGKPDRTRIQYLAARLMAGQTMNGGWGYKVPKLSLVEQATTLSALRKMSTPQPTPIPSVRDRPYSLGLCIKTSDDVIPQTPPKIDLEKGRTDALRTLSPAMRAWPVFLHANQVTMGDPDKKVADCNSNTHFATLAVWAARKHDVPVEQSLTLLARRFRTSQSADGAWGYSYIKGGGGGTPSMTCVALLGLAVGHVIDPEVGVPPEKDPKVVNGFAWLSKRIGAPAGTIDNRPEIKAVGGLYYMWAMERIAVIYDVTRLDKKDWYLWGAEILLGHQKADGSWEEGGYHGQHPVLNTSLALLFLRRANLTPDLSRRFTIDTTALTQKVADTVAPPRVDPPAPDPIPEPVAIAPPPREMKLPTVTPTPPAPATQVAAESPSSPPPPPKESSSLIWIILCVVLVLGLGILLFFLAKKKKQKEEEEEKPKKKKKKKGVKAKVDVVEDDDD
ncbi:MAG: hypothetical protein C0467_02800 [Planctomycetaceae bacterium]|nr:hypothetical protein [Planctomycetaceae bacterium]